MERPLGAHARWPARPRRRPVLLPGLALAAVCVLLGWGSRSPGAVLGTVVGSEEEQDFAEQFCSPSSYLRDNEGESFVLNKTQEALVADFQVSWRQFRRERPVQRVLAAARDASADGQIAELLINNTEGVLERMDGFAGFDAYAHAVVEVAQSHGAKVPPRSESRIRALAESMDALISWDNETQTATAFLKKAEEIFERGGDPVIGHSMAEVLSDGDVRKICRSIAPAFVSLLSRTAGQIIAGVLIALGLGAVFVGVCCACCFCR
mmetsp:Transcript_41528/g.83833  ORF Transcript_41528/g.83833 Transcript_41528/m.83833 type:complete len:265 (-) Transcript_41528:203-997(-)